MAEGPVSGSPASRAVLRHGMSECEAKFAFCKGWITGSRGESEAADATTQLSSTPSEIARRAPYLKFPRRRKRQASLGPLVFGFINGLLVGLCSRARPAAKE